MAEFSEASKRVLRSCPCDCHHHHSRHLRTERPLQPVLQDAKRGLLQIDVGGLRHHACKLLRSSVRRRLKWSAYIAKALFPKRVGNGDSRGSGRASPSLHPGCQSVAPDGAPAERGADRGLRSPLRGSLHPRLTFCRPSGAFSLGTSFWNATPFCTHPLPTLMGNRAKAKRA